MLTKFLRDEHTSLLVAVPKSKYKLSETKPHLIGIKQILDSTVHTLLPLSANLFCISSGFGNLAESQVMYLVERTRLQILNLVRLSTALHTLWNFECSSRTSFGTHRFPFVCSMSSHRTSYGISCLSKFASTLK